ALFLVIVLGTPAAKLPCGHAHRLLTLVGRAGARDEARLGQLAGRKVWTVRPHPSESSVGVRARGRRLARPLLERRGRLDRDEKPGMAEARHTRERATRKRDVSKALTDHASDR